MLEDILVPLSFFGATAYAIGKFVDSKHKERMAMIDRGMGFTTSPAPLAGPAGTLPIPNPRQAGLGQERALKWGLLLIFAGTGLLIGSFMDQFYGMIPHHLFRSACTLIGGGVGLTLFYLIVRPKRSPKLSSDLETTE